MAATAEQDDWIYRVLGVDAVDGPAPSLAELGLDVSDVWSSAREAFNRASDEVDGQVTALQAALREDADPELDDIAELGLNAMTGSTRVPLQAALMDAGSGDAARLQKASPKLRSAIRAFRSALKSDPRIAACDDNPFGVDVSIRDTYESALDQLEYAIDEV